MQGLFVPFACIGSGDPVRVLRLLHNKYSGYCCIHLLCKATYNLSLPRLSANYYGLPTTVQLRAAHESRCSLFGVSRSTAQVLYCTCLNGTFSGPFKSLNNDLIHEPMPNIQSCHIVERSLPARRDEPQPSTSRGPTSSMVRTSILPNPERAVMQPRERSALFEQQNEKYKEELLHVSGMLKDKTKVVNVVEPNNLFHSVIVDDKYTAIASHVDDNTRQKIVMGEYVDLVKLIPRDRVMAEEDQRMEMVNRGGLSYWVPINDRGDGSINNIAKWEEAFRIYSRIYTEGNPGRAIELIQYSHIIHEEALEYPWESVYAYDREFRVHMSKHPSRNWGIILQQAWTLKMRKSQKGNGYHSNSGRDNLGNGRNRNRNICWKSNQGRCTYGMSCKFEHRCAICNKWGHGAINCRRGRGSDRSGNEGYDYSDRETGERRSGNNGKDNQRSGNKSDHYDRYHYHRKKMKLHDCTSSV